MRFNDSRKAIKELICVKKPHEKMVSELTGTEPEETEITYNTPSNKERRRRNTLLAGFELPL